MATRPRKAAGRRDVPVFELSGGRPALDFANTVDNRPTSRRKDLLRDYGDLAAWARQAGVVPEAGERALLAEAARRPAAAARALARAVALREALYRAFSKLSAGGAPAAADLALLESEARLGAARGRLAREAGRYAWKSAAPARDLDRVLWTVVRDAVELLTSDRLALVRECAAIDCGWLFTDESRNRSRVWCDMAVCGNRAKARRHYAKSRGRSRRPARSRRGPRPSRR